MEEDMIQKELSAGEYGRPLSLTKESVTKYAKSLGIDAIGFTAFPLETAALKHLHDPQPCPFTKAHGINRLGPFTAGSPIASAIVCLFPYKADSHEGPVNLARYTWGEDYHTVIRSYLGKLVQYMENIEKTSYHEIHVDTSPLADRYMAYLAGLGFYGKNTCFIHPKWGSYLCIGTILSSIPFEKDFPMDRTCLSCNRCIEACPGQALGQGRFVYERCKSYLTQKKGPLDDYEKEIIGKTPLLFGCDICQEVCPHNAHIPTTPFKEFQHIHPYLSPDELSHMTNRQFKEAYGHRAFSWRGKGILLRNQSIITDYEKEKDKK